jgi:hypothetical protein
MKKHGVMHFRINCDMFVARKKEFATALEFITEAVKHEDCGEDIFTDADEAISKLLPFVDDNAYIAYRISECPDDPDTKGYWAFVDGHGIGHMQVWLIDMDAVRVRKGGTEIDGDNTY